MVHINLSNKITTPVLEDNGLPLCWLIQALDCISLTHLFTFGGDQFPYLSKLELVEYVNPGTVGAVFEYIMKKGVFEAFAHPWDEQLVVDIFSKQEEGVKQPFPKPLPKHGMKYRLCDADCMYVAEEENDVYEQSLMGGIVSYLEKDQPVVVAIPVDGTFQGRQRNMDPYQGPLQSRGFTFEEIESHPLIVTGVDDRDPKSEILYVKNCYGTRFANDGYDLISANIIKCYEVPLLNRDVNPWIEV
ncbi:hypothetical protein RJ640_014759 [Escallonia rubra]|uniref:Uncharacterized protein n=1 Tax=Escallonia rubra TaxID=112253 RepID=A0AA88RJF4_9ASTE|nr:hypothetical protein RJ640_014759 [Escallonia rubra]